jgi:hypothetical protein
VDPESLARLFWADGRGLALDALAATSPSSASEPLDGSFVDSPARARIAALQDALRSLGRDQEREEMGVLEAVGVMRTAAHWTPSERGRDGQEEDDRGEMEELPLGGPGGSPLQSALFEMRAVERRRQADLERQLDEARERTWQLLRANCALQAQVRELERDRDDERDHLLAELETSQAMVRALMEARAT